MTANTWPDPARPGLPLNPEKDGWHWLEDSVDGVGTGHIEAVYYAAWSVPVWYRAGNRSPITKPKQWRYLGPVLTPDEATALQKRADRNATGFARVDAKMRRAKFLHKQEIAALQKRVAKLEGALDFYACVDHYQTHNAAAPNVVQFDRGAKARAALEGKKDD